MPKVQSSHAFTGKSNIQGQHLLLRHRTVWFYLSDVRLCDWGWEVRPPALTYVPEPQKRVSEKALRINLQLLWLSRHTRLYLFNHTCLWTINNFNRAHKYSACWPGYAALCHTPPMLVYVWVCLYLWGNAEVFHLFGGVNLWLPSSVMRWDNLFGYRELAGNGGMVARILRTRLPKWQRKGSLLVECKDEEIILIIESDCEVQLRFLVANLS